MSVTHSANSIVEVADVSFRFDAQPVLEHITLQVRQGDYVGIIGPNGGGKTTLLKIMLGLLRPDTGAVSLFGTDVASFRDWHSIGYVSQKAVRHDSHFPVTVYEVVAMGRAIVRGIGRALNRSDEAAILEAMSRVGIEMLKHRRIGELSGGQQQRVFIARALVSYPHILFLDEPTVGVDLGAQQQFYDLLKNLNQSMGLTLVLVSHDIDVIASQATNIAFINGRLLYYGPTEAADVGGLVKELYGENMKFIRHEH